MTLRVKLLNLEKIMLIRVLFCVYTNLDTVEMIK